MATLLATGFEVEPAGTAIGNTTGNGGDAFSAGTTGAGAAFVSDSSVPASIAEGSLSGKITIGATAVAIWRGWSLAAPQSFRNYLYIPTGHNITGAWDLIQAVHTTGGTATVARFRINTNGTLVHVLGSTVGTATTGTIPTDALFRVEGTWDTPSGTFTAEAYLGHDTTPIPNTAISLTGVAFADTIEQLRIGFPTTGFANALVYTDGWGVSDAGRLGPLATGPAPVVVAAGLSGSGSLSGTTQPLLTRTGALSGSGSLTGTASPSLTLTVALSGAGTLVATAGTVAVITAALTGSGALDAETESYVRVYRFRTPTQDVPYRIKGHLFGTALYGLSVWRIDGVWSIGAMPSAEVVAAADRFYGGGRIHTLTPDERTELIAGGFGDYLTLEDQ